MGINFPTPTAVGQSFSPYGGPSYVWNGSAWKRADLTALPRNRAINGSMQVGQEVGYAVGTVSGYSFADMWATHFNAGVVTSQRQLDTAAGFNRLAASVTTAKPTLAAGDYVVFQTNMEGNRVADFQWGTANALPAVARFLAVSVGITGTFAFIIRNNASDRSFVAPFNLVSGVWTWVTIPVPGDTTGAWPKDNTMNMWPSISVAAGSTMQAAAGWNAGNFLGFTGQANFLSSTSNAFYFANFGLYLDPASTGVPPPWEEPDYATTFRECQRYYEEVPATVITNGYAPWPYFGWGYQVTKRVSPALTFKAGNPLGAVLYTQAFEPTWGCRHASATSYADVLIAVNAK